MTTRQSVAGRSGDGISPGPSSADRRGHIFALTTNLRRSSAAICPGSPARTSARLSRRRMERPLPGERRTFTCRYGRSWGCSRRLTRRSIGGLHSAAEFLHDRRAWGGVDRAGEDSRRGSASPSPAPPAAAEEDNDTTPPVGPDGIQHWANYDYNTKDETLKITLHQRCQHFGDPGAVARGRHRSVADVQHEQRHRRDGRLILPK